MKQMIYKKDRESKVLDKGTYKGFDYIILSLGTHPCAYVNIPANHKYFEKDYDSIDIDCHGGLTYANKKVTKSDIEGWWIGWDYAHSGDFYGYDMEYGDYSGYKYTTEGIFQEVKRVVDQLLEVSDVSSK